MNKLKMIALMALVSMNVMFFSACKKDGDAAKYTVTFQTNGGSTIDPLTVTSGDKLTKPTDPTKAGFTFVGWYKEESLTNEFDVTNTPITANLTLYAKWATAVISVTYNTGTTGIPTIAPKVVDKSVGSFTIVPPLAYSQNKQVLVWYTDNTYTKPFDFGHSTITASITLYAKLQSATVPNILLAQYIPDDVADNDTRAMLQPYIGSKASIVPVYVTVGGTGDGSSWINAKGSVKDAIDGITDASTSKVYLILVASGIYKAGEPMSMKNNVAIIGGWATDWTRSGTTALDGERNYQVFNNTDLNHSALLYGLSITNAHAQNSGGGMANHHSSPILTQVTFSGNFAGLYGAGMYNANASAPVLTQVTFSDNFAGKAGGMYNDNSSPVLTQVSFLNNKSDDGGGGMYNANTSAPILTRVTFSGNLANTGSGGGMYNDNSSPILMQVTFSGNTANGTSNSFFIAGLGGGMANVSSAPILIQTTFVGNSAANTKSGGGGAMYNDNNGATPIIINSIFWGNKAGTAEQQISLFNDANVGIERLSIYNTIVQGGIGGSPTASGTAGHSFGGGLGLYSTQNVMINYASVITASPGLNALTDNGGSLKTIAINSGNSSAVNAGLYVKRDGTNFYFSNKNSTWFSDPSLTTSATPPSTAVEVTATDARGYARTGTPDLGAYEYGATAP